MSEAKGGQGRMRNQQDDHSTPIVDSPKSGKTITLSSRTFLLLNALIATLSGVILDAAAQVVPEGLSNSWAFALSAILGIAILTAAIQGLDPTRRQGSIENQPRLRSPIRDFFNSQPTKVRLAIFSFFVICFALTTASVYDLVKPTPRAAITFPTAGQEVDRVINIKGTSSNFTRSHILWFGRRELWIVVIPKNTPRYYPQSGPVSVQTNGGWTSLPSFLGNQEDTGRKDFRVLAIRTNWSAGNQFRTYLTNGDSSGNFPGLVELPKGAQILDERVVIRQS